MVICADANPMIGFEVGCLPIGKCMPNWKQCSLCASSIIMNFGFPLLIKFAADSFADSKSLHNRREFRHILSATAITSSE